MSAPFPIGSVIRGRHKSNFERRAKVWALNPNNPRRVVLWMRSGQYSWNNVASLDVNYEAAPADELTWPDPLHPPPPDPNDAPKKATPVELVAMTTQPLDPGPAPVVPPPEPQTAPQQEATVIVLRGARADAFNAKVALLTNIAKLTGGTPLDPASLVTMAVDQFVSGLMGGAS